MVYDVSEWLEKLGLGQYASNFANNDVDTQLLSQITNSDLKELGISSLGHRKKILSAAKALSGAELKPESTTAPNNEAERRQLTVMFCDLVGSTELSQQLDPEDLREVNRAYQDACKRAIEHYEGYVARYMGDGVLAYFGYPQAHEDDAERAIHAGLGVVEKISDLVNTIGKKFGTDLGVRVGIATGLVVVGDLIGEAASQESAVVGETPNRAARFQTLASHNAVVIGPGTHELVAGRFEYENLGQHILKGIADPLQVWRVIAPTTTDSRFEAAHQSELTPLVGRENETGLLLGLWEQAKVGDGQVVLLSGEAGVGKSRITEVLRERSKGDDPVILRYQCSPYHTNSALHPIIKQLERAAQFQSRDTNEIRLDKIESLLALGKSDVEATASLLALLLSIPSGERYATNRLTPDRQKEEMFDALVAHIEALSHHRPLLLIFEDAHWADPTSLELLGLIIAKTQSIPLLTVITFRPEFSPPWSEHMHITSLTLKRFTGDLVMTMVDKVTKGKSLPEEVQQQIVENTDGVPLFVEELTKTILESDLLTEESDQYTLSRPLSRLAIPATLQDSLMARLDRLAKGKQVAQVSAAIGREFSRKLLEPVCGLQPAELDDALEELVASGLVYRYVIDQSNNYMFKHALVQEAAYSSLLRSKRRSLHGHIASALLTLFPKITEAQPELLAHHFTQAKNNEIAIGYWLQAGRRAAESSANKEAIAHLNKGLVVLHKLPESNERARQELDFQLVLCGSIMIIKGWGSEETAGVYARARELCTLLGESKHLRSVLNGEYMHELSLAHFQAARDKAADLLQLGEQQQDVEVILQGHRILGWGNSYLGEFSVANIHIDEVLRLYDPALHDELKFRYVHDPRVAALSLRAIIQSLCGYPDQAIKTAADVLDYAKKINHTSSLAYGIMFAGALPATLRHDSQMAGEYAKDILLLSEQLKSEMWLGFGRVIAGWSSGIQGSYEDGEKLLRMGIKNLESASPNPHKPLFQMLLAEIYISGGETRRAIDSLTRALKLVEQTDERIWESGVNCLLGKAQLIHETNISEKAEAKLIQAIKVAAAQNAKTLELRAAVSLTQEWLNRGKRDEARDLISPIYNWFTEGFDTPDLIEARKLLELLI